MILAHCQRHRVTQREALPFAQKAVEKDGGSAASTYVLGLASEKLGNTDDAARYYSVAVQKNPKFAPALINLGGIYDSQGMPDKALPLLLAAQDVDPDSYELHNNLGNVYLHQQQYDQSITHLSRALSIQPTSSVTVPLAATAKCDWATTSRVRPAHRHRPSAW